MITEFIIITLIMAIIFIRAVYL